MDLIEVELAGEIEQGRPLFPSAVVVRIPSAMIDVVAFRGPNIFLGRWWAKRGLHELRLSPHESVEGEFEVAGAVTLIVRQS